MGRTITYTERADDVTPNLSTPLDSAMEKIDMTKEEKAVTRTLKKISQNIVTNLLR